jgi:hypothetical protein
VLWALQHLIVSQCLLCCPCRRPVMICGPAGVGKTAVVSERLAQLVAAGGVTPLVLNFSARTSSGATQAALEAKLERRRQTRWAGWWAQLS